MTNIYYVTTNSVVMDITFIIVEFINFAVGCLDIVNNGMFID